MKDLPENPSRYRAAIFMWALITGVFIVLLLYRLFVAPTDAVWVGLFGIGTFVGLWRWILTARRSRDAEHDEATE